MYEPRNKQDKKMYMHTTYAYCHLLGTLVHRVVKKADQSNTPRRVTTDAVQHNLVFDWWMFPIHARAPPAENRWPHTETRQKIDKVGTHEAYNTKRDTASPSRCITSMYHITTYHPQKQETKVVDIVCRLPAQKDTCIHSSQYVRLRRMRQALRAKW